ncbi:hypothetical protein ZYGR_0AD05410 [Zygosaccharomyces rouxii]|uniref:non-specific serine/threonine protein kinase n=2 Tax=Zygosaccharomyces rouxii TaxID=4956 RepID=C5E169_ZYGRC|nr:uncharacterized protein ZYRO0G18546g [Zygosaccharomyces rouxii]KAH9202846.1 kinase-like domain-containing protein [Zygosaccharomyces rouxii]GAV51358.1 hypothetical protein ZYGR_0AD05410 [Zygosaccharomyces rouxii]CAR29853.1 ZYRO0G18546p [Zygosaccharomyces rouxii]
MGSNDEKPPRQALPKRGRSFSESLRGLFKQQSNPPTPNNSANTSRDNTAPPSPVSEGSAPGPKRNNSKGSKLGKLASNKEAELSSSRGAPPQGVASQAIQSNPAGVTTKQHHLGLPHLGKLSLGHDSTGVAATGSDNDAFSQESYLSEEEDLSQMRRQQSPDVVPEVDEEGDGIQDNPPRTGSASSMDSTRHHRNIPPVGATNLNPNVSIDAALENEDMENKNHPKYANPTYARNGLGFLKRGNNSSSSSLSSKGSYSKNKTRSHADTVSASNLSKYSESDSKCILQVENFKVFENGTHEHNLKVTPLVSETSDKGGESLTRQKSAFSLTHMFKPRKEDNKLLEGAVSLIPDHRRHRIYDNDSGNGSGDDENDKESLLEEDMSDIRSKSKLEKSKGGKADDENLKTPKIVNPMAAVGSEELKLINTLSERIHKSFKSKGSKSHVLGEGHSQRRSEPLEEVEKKGSKFFEVYGKPVGIIGHGAYGTVKVCARARNPKDALPLPSFSNGKRLFFGVKELRPKSTDKIEQFSTRITSEFIIGHSLGRCQKNSKGAPNILKILDLMECHDSFIEVMEFCPSGDLYNLLTRKSKTGTVLHPIEADCFMKQLLHGVQFMHMHGVAHCDLKPENILFYPNGLLKICDFGTSCVFQTAWEKHVHFQSGTMGSEPYVAPEEFNHSKEYDPRLADCWSCGVVYCTMVLGHYLWKVAIRGKDMLYDSFCRPMAEEKEFTVFEEMRHANPEINRLRKIALYYIFQVDPTKRITVDELLQTSWMKKTKCCVFYSRGKP